MSTPLLPEPERLEAFRRLVAMLADAPAEETLSLAAIMISEFLRAYRVRPGSRQWKAFFKEFISNVAADIAVEGADSPQTPLH
jgi:hypothetical protein